MQAVSLNPVTDKARKLLLEGIQAFSEIESTGMRINVDWVKKQQKRLTIRIKQLEEKILSDPVVKQWKQDFGLKFSLDSGQQLSHVLFNILKEKPIKETASGKPAVDKEVLTKLSDKHPFLQDLLLMRKLKKARDTYLKNLLLETVDGWLHPHFNLHSVRTFRSSSSNPNFQNIPTRDPDIGKIIRKSFIPRGPDYMFGGCDYGSQEVRIAACYHKDPVMLKYLQGHGDLHKDVAAMCYICEPEQVSKWMRKVAKNKFTFPQFYGDYYRNCAKGLWEGIFEQNLTLADNTPLLDHLKKHGIKNYDDFEKHIQKVESDFWGKKFKVYAKWKETWIDTYNKTGYIDMYTGFRCQGIMGKNDVINYPVQGSAFHCMLWSLIQVYNWLKENNMKTKIVGQIHDEIVLDLHKDEKDYVLPQMYQIMVIDIKKDWGQWIIAPLEMEAEFCEPGGTWYDKHEIQFLHPEG